jgi:type I restriction enzyme S subunit
MITTQLSDAVLSANTGLDAIQRAPIVEEDTGIKCLRIQDISQSKQYSDWGFCDVTDNNFSRFQLQHGDILIARTGGSIGVNTFIREKVQSVFNNGLIRLRINTEKFLPKFIYYTLRIPAYREHIDSIAFGTSTQPNMQIKDLLRYEFPTCNLRQQETIVSIMSALDDKIELNRRMNATLEAMARALFQSWFVDFDPVRANLDGRPPIGIDAATAALFPASFTHDCDAVYPAGWRRLSVTEDISLARGIEPGRDACNNKKIGKRFIRVGDVTGKRESDLYTNIETDVDVKVGEILVSFDGTPGAVSYTSEGVFSTGLRKLEGLKTKIHPCYLWCLAKSDGFQSTINEYAIGTTILHASAAIPHLSRVVSSPEVMKAFGSLVDPIWKQMLNLYSESRTLATLRDTLLPKLLNGELRVQGSTN